MSTTAPVPIAGSTAGEHRLFGSKPTVSSLPSSRAGAPDFQVQGAALHGFHGARDGRTPGLVRKICADATYAKKAGAGPARPDWNSELFGAVEFGRLLLKLLIAEIIGHRPTMPLSQPSWTIALASLDIFSQLLTLKISNTNNNKAFVPTILLTAIISQHLTLTLTILTLNTDLALNNVFGELFTNISFPERLWAKGHQGLKGCLFESFWRKSSPSLLQFSHFPNYLRRSLCLISVLGNLKSSFEINCVEHL